MSTLCQNICNQSVPGSNIRQVKGLKSGSDQISKVEQVASTLWAQEQITKVYTYSKEHLEVMKELGLEPRSIDSQPTVN